MGLTSVPDAALGWTLHPTLPRARAHTDKAIVASRLTPGDRWGRRIIEIGWRFVFKVFSVILEIKRQFFGLAVTQQLQID